MVEEPVKHSVLYLKKNLKFLILALFGLEINFLKRK